MNFVSDFIDYVRENFPLFRVRMVGPGLNGDVLHVDGTLWETAENWDVAEDAVREFMDKMRSLKKIYPGSSEFVHLKLRTTSNGGNSSMPPICRFIK